MVELSHFVTVVSDQVEETERLIGSFHVDVDFPSEMRLLVHDVASGQPAEIDIVILILLALDLEETLFAILKISSRS